MSNRWRFLDSSLAIELKHELIALGIENVLDEFESRQSLEAAH